MPCGRNHLLQRLWKLDIELLPWHIFNPAAGRIRVAVRKRNVGLDVVDGRAVAQIGSQHMDDGTVVGKLDTIELDADKTVGLGRNGLRVANTPTRSAPPKRGGRTVFDHLALVPDLSCVLAST